MHHCEDRHRPDLTPNLYHFIRKENNINSSPPAVVLRDILKDGVIKATKSYIPGEIPSVCMTETPIAAIKWMRKYNSRFHDKYSQYGIGIPKEYFYIQGGRPILYIGDNEYYAIAKEMLNTDDDEKFNKVVNLIIKEITRGRIIIPYSEQWRVCRFTYWEDDGGGLQMGKDWRHEREWRKKEDLVLPTDPIVFVPAKKGKIDVPGALRRWLSEDANLIHCKGAKVYCLNEIESEEDL